MEKLAFKDFVERIKLVNCAVGIGDQSYKQISCNNQWYHGIRESTRKEFKISVQRLYEGYLNCTVINTSTLKQYVDRVQSPSYAILKAANLI